MHSFDFKLNDSNKKLFSINIAVEVIRHLLYVDEVISSTEFQNVIKNANRSVNK